MLISRVPEEGAGRGEPADIASNCRTASELFDLMTKNHDFEAGDDPLTTSDLVLLYKNIDLGNQLMSNVVRGRPNQYVEDVYHDDPETDSDLSESCSSEELRNIMLANKDRIELFTNPPSLNTLCHKLGDLEIQVSSISNDLYDDRHFINKDQYIKEQLQNLHVMSKAYEVNTLLPTSLLDYICCKRMEDNYNFYMDNIITYVKHTIDQLKRISNGDYLPEIVKEKWKELDLKSTQNSSKVITTSISMPLQVRQKNTGMMTAWDDIVQTEVDLRSLVKILGDKIVLEVPRMISGSYNMFSWYKSDKLVISCSRRQRSDERSRAKPRVDVVLSVRRASAGQLVSNIDSIIVLQPEAIQKDDTEVLSIEYNSPGDTDTLIPKVIELPKIEQDSGNKCSPKSDEFGSLCSVTDATYSEDGDCRCKDGAGSSSPVPQPGSSGVVAHILSTATRVVRAEAASNHVIPNELNFSITNLNRQTSLPEESSSDAFYTKTKKKSPERTRIKSPYDNKSFILEERKRKKLLELRERRERRKKISNEISKMAKHKTFPQAVSSVTKLSITNKAFYNSIYGRNTNGENSNRMSTATTSNTKARKGTQKIDEEIEESEGEEALTDKPLKNICNNHFLDDTETEMSYLQSKQGSDFLRISTSTSCVSTESASNLYPQSECFTSSVSFSVNGQQPGTPLDKQRQESREENPKSQNKINNDPTDASKVDNHKAPALECRRSLEKIYTLMKKLQQIETTETAKKKTLANESRGLKSESGSSLKRRVSFSNPRLEKLKNEHRTEKDDDREKPTGDHHKQKDEDLPSAGVPKVVISAKLQTKADEKGRIKSKPGVKTIPENPIKAISQLLQEFDNVQKSRPKIADPKSINRSVSTEKIQRTRKRRSETGSPVKEDPRVVPKVKSRFVREERPEVVKPQVLEKKINDLIEEEKEARGEAVRGPPRFSSRLHALAQPKRSYVQALAEEFTKRQTPDRPQRPTPHLSRARRRPDGRLSPISVRAPHSSLGGKGKVAVESPGRCRSPEPAGPARAPLLPCDVHLSSGSSYDTDDIQSSSIGLKLHHMVSAVLRERARASRDASPPPPPPPVASACDVQVKLLQKDIVTREMFVEKADIQQIFTDEETNEPTNEKFEVKHVVTPVNSVTELKQLEYALHRSLSSGAFPGRLRVNKLTLSPRPSLQRVVMHQSGDTTLVLKSNFTHKLKVTCQSSDRETDLIGLLSKTRLDCGFSEFPLQISTVGFAFPDFQTEIKKIRPRILNSDMSKISEAGTSCTLSEKVFSVTNVLVIKEEKGVNTDQPLADEERVIEQVIAADLNVETSAISAGNGSKEASASANNENCQPSEFTTSFDILVGLLNEIQKITTCGSDVAISQILGSTTSESSPEGSTAEAPSSSRDTVSYMRSDDRLGTFIPEMKSVSAEAVEFKPVCKDKEVLARVVAQHAAASTSQQSGFPNDIATATCTNFISNCSVSAFTHSEYRDTGCNTLALSGDKMIDQMGIDTNRSSVKSLVPYYNNMFKVEMKNVIASPENVPATGTKRNVAAVCNILVDIPPAQKSRRVVNKCKLKNVTDNKEGNKVCLNANELDSTLKVKRDILVTFYSILVLTVFAALAFPEMLQYA